MDFKDLQLLIERMVDQSYVGIDICVHHKNKEVFRGHAGYSDRENNIPVRLNAQYYIFSCSKPITCTAALQLMEKGHFLLSDPVSNYLPEFKDMTVKVTKPNGMVDYVKADRPITIKHLFTMTSGLNYDLNTPYIEEVKKNTNGKCPTSEIVKAIAKNPLEFQPGTHFRYSLSHDVLARLVEVISGMSFGEYLKKNIFDLCEIKNTGFAVTEDIRKNMPPMYAYDEQKKVFVKRENTCEYRFGEDSIYESGGAGLVSCVDDYIKFTDMMVNGGVSPITGERIINKRTIDLMRLNTLEGDCLTDFMKSPTGYGYGLGVRTMIDPVKAGSLSNIGEFGWDGAAGSYLIMDPEAELSVFAAKYIRNYPSNDVCNRKLLNTIYSIISK